VRIALLCAAALLAGCAAGATTTRLADGAEGIVLSCSGALRSWATCLERAGELCGARGYEVLDRHEELGLIASDTTRVMVLRCRR
jgi:hypothetical protein